MSELTLHFDNAREASDLTALPKETLSEVERLFGVALTARDTWLKIEGDVVRHPLVQKIIRAYRHHRA